MGNRHNILRHTTPTVTHPNRRPDMHYAIAVETAVLVRGIPLAIFKVTMREDGEFVAFHLVKGRSVTVNKRREPLERMLAAEVNTLEGEQ